MKTTCTETYEATKARTSAPATSRIAPTLADPRPAPFRGTRMPSGLQTIVAVVAVVAVWGMQVVAGGVPPRGAPR